MNLKKIGDELTDAELNTYISLLVHNTSLNEKITIKHGIVNGDYAKYTFDLSSASIVDNGILITNKTLTDGLNVILSDCFNASYELNLTVVRFGEINILDENTDETILHITIPLIQNEIVDITSIGEFEEYDVISFDASIKIKHDKPVIIGNWVTGLSLGSNKSVIQGSETATLTVTATDLESLPVINKDIKLFDNSNLLDTITTDSNGQTTKVISSTGSGKHTYQAKYKNSIVSDELELIDAYFYDTGILGTASTDYTNGSAVTRAEATNEGTIYEVTNSTTTNYLRKTNTSFTGDFEAIIYVNSPDYNARFGVTDGSDRIYCLRKINGYLKLIRENNVTSAYYSTNGSDWTNMSISGTEPSTDTVNVFIGIYNNTNETWSLTYRDLIVYKVN